MNNNFLRALEDQKNEIKNIKLQKLCPRVEESSFEFDSPLAQIVIGVRRSGKSTLCHKVLQDKNIKYAYINFDDERFLPLKGEELNELLEATYFVYGNFSYLFIDEIQNIPEWFLFVNRLLRQGIHLFITGSNANLLSSELSTHLTGRYNQIELFPFSFKEYCIFSEIEINDFSTKGNSLIKKSFSDYLTFGGFPELSKIKNKHNYINSLFESILYRDISQRFNIRYKDTFKKIAINLTDNFAREFACSRIAKQFDISSTHTIENYIAYLKQAYLILELHKFSTKSKERVRNRKGYLVDVAFISERENVFESKNLGWRLENIVFIELLRRNKNLFFDTYYYKNNYEIDFIVCDKSKVISLIQVSLDISDKRTYNREINSLIKGANELHCTDLLLVGLSTENNDIIIEDKTIKIRNITDWLLDRKTA